MIVNFSYPIGKIIKNCDIVFLESAPLANFPIAFIGKKSYAADITIESGLDLNLDYIYNLHIGRYCSIAHNVRLVAGLGHEYKNVFMGDLGIEGLSVPKRTNQKGQILIQNDVWIGRGVTIMGGVTIHNGAVIAANSHVVKDVETYSIVGGNPAKHIKYRFEPDIVAKLQRIQWWYWSDNYIAQNKRFFEGDTASFADHFAPKLKALLPKQRPDIPRFELTFFCVVDCEAGQYSTWEQVLRQFSTRYRDMTDCGLILFVFENVAESFYTQVSAIAQTIDSSCELFITSGGEDEMKAIIPFVDYYISSRTEYLVENSCIAALNNVNLISAVDTDIFASTIVT